MARSPGSAQWHLVGARQRRAVAGSAAARLIAPETRLRRLQQRERGGTIEQSLSHLSACLAEPEKIDVNETLVAGTFAGAKKGIWGRPYGAGRGDENHRYRRSPLSSARRANGERAASGGNVGGGDAEGQFLPAEVRGPIGDKARQHGFHDCIDTEDMLRKWIARYREAGLLPA